MVARNTAIVARKILTCAGVVLLVCLLAGCARGVLEPDENTFYISIRNQCDSDIYGVHHEYYLDNEPEGGGGTMYADQTPIRQGDTLNLEFTPADFPEDADLATFSLELYVMLEDGQEIPVDEPLIMPVDYGQVYSFSLYGSNSEGFYLIEDES